MVLIQVSREQTGKRYVTLGQINAFLEKMSDLTSSQIEFKYCPLPYLASFASVSFAGDVPDDKKFKWSIFEFPLL